MRFFIIFLLFSSERDIFWKELFLKYYPSEVFLEPNSVYEISCQNKYPRWIFEYWFFFWKYILDHPKREYDFIFSNKTLWICLWNLVKSNENTDGWMQNELFDLRWFYVNYLILDNANWKMQITCQAGHCPFRQAHSRGGNQLKTSQEAHKQRKFQ